MYIHDPKVDPNQIALDLNLKPHNSIGSNSETQTFSEESNWYSASDIEIALEESDAAVILTEWIEYSQINWNKISKKMRKPAWVFDARSIVDPKTVIKSGLNFWRIGDGVL